MARGRHGEVFAVGSAVAFQHDSRVVIQPWRAALEQRTDDDDAELLGQCGEKIRRRAGDRLGEIEQLGRFVLAEVQRGMERSEEHTSELQSLMRISYAVFCLKKKKISCK